MKIDKDIMKIDKDIMIRRIVAILIDNIILIILSFLLAILIGTYGEPLYKSLVQIIILWISYGIILEAWKGQTVGKMILGIIIIKEDGSPCDLFSAIIRNVFRIIDVLPAFYLIGFLFIILSEKGQGREGDSV